LDFAPDLVYVTGVWLAALGRELGDHPCVVAPLDAAHLNFEAQAVAARGLARPVLRAASRRVARFEASHYAAFDRVLVLSGRDRDALLAIRPTLEVEVIPHAVDESAFLPPAIQHRERGRIIFHGVLSVAPNITAAEFLAREVMPLVRAAMPRANLAIVGRTPSRRVRALGRLDGVRVIGEVRDIAAWLAGSHACAVPMLTGAGVKNKLLEAMASGLPCVVTRLALGGMCANPGRDLLVGEGADEFAAQLVRVLQNDKLAAALGAAARAYVMSQHSAAAVATELTRIFDKVVAEHGHAHRSISQVCRESPPSTTRSMPVT
jgi:glycosyltransferase involved in cell wall biosynthesis